MSVFSSIDVYPSFFDDTRDIELNCDECTFECGLIGYCIKECGGNYIINTLLENKGYKHVNLDYIIFKRECVPCIQMYTRQCKKFIDDLERLGYSGVMFHHPRGKAYLSHVIIDGGVDPVELCDVFLDLEMVK